MRVWTNLENNFQQNVLVCYNVVESCFRCQSMLCCAHNTMPVSPNVFLRSYHCVSVMLCYVESHHNAFGIGCNVAPVSISYGRNFYSNADNLPFNAEGLLREL